MLRSAVNVSISGEPRADGDPAVIELARPARRTVPHERGVGSIRRDMKTIEDRIDIRRGP